jgi:hypothetical protein
MIAPSGEQIEIAAGDQQAVVVQVGGGLRAYSAGGRELVDGRLPRPIAAIVAIAGFLFLINVFSGLDDVWFHWPVAPLVLIVVLWAVFRRKS